MGANQRWERQEARCRRGGKATRSTVRCWLLEEKRARGASPREGGREGSVVPSPHVAAYAAVYEAIM